MKFIKITVLLLFSIILLLPVITFNFKENAVSEIDNRVLTGNPFKSMSNTEVDFSTQIENYINDRLGFRDDMILTYTILNDKIFNTMVHPIYSYGKDKCVFGEGLELIKFSDYHKNFVNMIKKIQDYCDNRKVPFLFVFNPAKPAIMRDFIPEGINYDRTWVTKFMKDLDEKGINYLDNTNVLLEEYKKGNNVFNMKYDANHWNDLGAYYGSNAILQKAKKVIPTVHTIELNELNIVKKEEKTLLVSEFPIDELVPSISIKDMNVDTTNTKAFAKELDLHKDFKGFGYAINNKRKSEKAPRALVFQGSYMNSYGYKYLQNGFGEYINVHDYQNILDFPYYFNIFKPEYVIFEVGEYTLKDYFFNYEKMKQIDFNPPLKSILSKYIPKKMNFDNKKINVSIDNKLTKLKYNLDSDATYAWCTLGDNEYDMTPISDGFETTVLTEDYKNNKLKFFSLENNTLKIYE